jgi:hypothetical protein
VDLDMEELLMRLINRVVSLAAATLIVTASASASAGWRYEENGPHPIAKGQEHLVARVQPASSGSGAEYERRCETVKPFKCHPERS